MHPEPETDPPRRGRHTAVSASFRALPPLAAPPRGGGQPSARWADDDVPGGAPGGRAGVGSGGAAGGGSGDTEGHGVGRVDGTEGGIADAADQTVLGWRAGRVRPGEPRDRSPVAEESLASGGQATLTLEVPLGESPRVLRRSQEPTPIPAAWQHPHLVKVLGQSADRRETALELVPGGSLPDLVALRGPLPVGEVVTLMVPLAQALSHLHAAGVAHGDVAPQNVLFGSEGEPQLVDPGLVRALGAAPALAGTEGFAPPEREVGLPGDVYGWAATAWFALTGHAPGPALHRTPLPLVLPEVHPETARLLEDCLEPDPALRPEAGDLAAALTAHQRPEPLDSSQAVTSEGAAHMVTIRPPQTWWARRIAPLWGRWAWSRGAWPARRTAGVRPAGRRGEGGRGGGRGAATGAPGWRALVLGGCTVALLASLGWALLALRPFAGEAPAQASLATPAVVLPAEAVAALPALDRARTAALRHRDAAGLAQVYVEGAPARATDERTIAALLRRGEVFEGLGSRVEDLAAQGQPSATGEVVVTGRGIVAGHRLVPSHDPAAPAGSAGAASPTPAKESSAPHTRGTGSPAVAGADGPSARGPGAVGNRAVGSGAAEVRETVERRLTWTLRRIEGGWRIVSVSEAGG